MADPEKGNGMREEVTDGTQSPFQSASPTEKYAPDVSTQPAAEVSKPNQISFRNWSTIPDTQPKPLARQDFVSIVLAVGRFIISLGFIAFGFLAYTISQMEDVTSFQHDQIVRFTEWLPTIFPIAFTALTSKALRDIAVGLSIRGTRLLTIEQLLQYNSVGSAFMVALFKLRVYDILTFALVLLWSFSPIGGQGGLKMLVSQESKASSGDDFAYYILPNATVLNSPEVSFQLNNRTGEIVEFAEHGTQLDSLFLGGLFSSVRNDIEAPELTRDNVGNVRIPMLSRLQGIPDADGWLALGPDSQLATITDGPSQGLIYSSFLGIPVLTSLKKHSHFQIESSYLEFTCFDKHKAELAKNETVMLWYTSQYSSEFYTGAWLQPHWLFNVTIISPPQLEGSGNVRRTEPLKLRVRSIRLTERLDVDELGLPYNVDAVEFDCSVEEKRVEVELECEPSPGSSKNMPDTIGSGICEISRMRESQKPTITTNDNGQYTTVLDTMRNVTVYDFSENTTSQLLPLSKILFDNLPYVGKNSIRHPLEPTRNTRDLPLLPELYLLDPSNLGAWNKKSHLNSTGTSVKFFESETLNRDHLDLLSVSLDDFGVRLTILFNSFYQSTQSSYIRSEGIPANWTSYKQLYDEAMASFDDDNILSEIQARIYHETSPENMGRVVNNLQERQMVFELKMLYWVLYMVSSFVLFICVFTSFVYFLHYNGHVAAPDLMGYFSTVTRDNPYIKISKDGDDDASRAIVGSGLDGAKRAIYLKDLRIRLGDVQPEEEYGRIAFFREDEPADNPAPLLTKERFDRKYI